jgi:mannose-6-phosphate isomerase-like protein (cupin superfamily)
MPEVTSDVSRKPSMINREEDRFGDSLRFSNGRFDLKVSASDTGGGMCIFDTIRTERGGPPLHFHESLDEWFYVTEGQFVIQVGENTYRLGPGDAILGPRGVPHAFTNVTETGRLLIVFQPAGTMEQFFRSGSILGEMTPEQFRVLSKEHGMEVVGPPLSID